MVEKIEIKHPNGHAAYLKYTYTESELVVGGSGKHIDFIDLVVLTYLKDKRPLNVHTQRGKVRYVYEKLNFQYRKIKERMSKDFGRSFKKIKNLDRRL